MHLTVNDLNLPPERPLKKGYYRSKLFTAPKTTNPILNAATPIFSLLERLNASLSPPPLEITYQHLEHEWLAYRSRLGGLSQTQQVTLMAEYLMSATIDELLAKPYLRTTQTAPEFLAFTPSSHHEGGPEAHFFKLVFFIKEHPNEYLDLIELAYYCLTAGFEGEQHLKTDGRQILDNLIQALYENIQTYRVYKPIQLFKPARLSETPPPEKTFSPWIWRAVMIGTGLLTFFYLGSQFILDQEARSLYHQVSRLHLEA